MEAEPHGPAVARGAGTTTRVRATKMMKHTDTRHAPWYILDSNDKRRARLNAIAHILSSIPYKNCARRTSNYRAAR